MNLLVVNSLKLCNFGSNVPKNMKNYYIKILELINYFQGEEQLKVLNSFYNQLFEEKYTNLNDLENDLVNVLIDKILKSYIFSPHNNEFNYNIYELYLAIDKIVHLSRVKYNQENDSYKVYPNFNIVDNPFDLEHKEELRYILDIYFSHDKSIVEIFNIVRETLNQEGNKKINNIKNGNLEPYCGDVNFMMERAKYILECIEKILLSQNVNGDIKNEFKKYYPSIKELVSGIIMNSEMLDNSFNSSKYDIYDKIEERYKKVLQYEESLSHLMQPIWDDYLTDALQYKPGEPFRFMTHTLTGGYISADKMTKACCTLITNECMPIPFGDYGYIMKFDISNVGTMCNEDAGSWLTSKNEFIERLFPDRWQMYEKVGNQYVWYEYPKLSKLILPWNMEYEMYIHNKNNHTNYTEIFMKSTDRPLTSTAFFALNRTGEHNIKKITKEYGLEIPSLCLNEFSNSKKY